MSQCKKFAPNIFHKTKCSNCFRQKEEHTAEALECNRASRSIARSGYLFVAPDWDFSVPLNRTKRWQRRWFVLYDDGELNYSVDEHPDTIPQGSVDMSKVLEVTGAEQITGHPHSLALTSPDRVTFVKAASREDARWWAELLAVFPRRHKRNATFPGGRASPSLPQLGRSASPQPPRPRHLSCTQVVGPSPRTNFETPPLKEERESPPKDDSNSNNNNNNGGRPGWVPEPTRNLPIIENSIRNDYLISSGSPPTRDKLRCDDKARARRDWRNERLRDIATALTDRSPESSLALPAESLLHLKKGWLWLKNNDSEFVRRWVVLSGPTLNIYHDQDEQSSPEIIVELSTVINYNEVPTDSKYGFEIKTTELSLILSAVTSGIRSNWLQALKKAAPIVAATTITPPPEMVVTPTTPKSMLLSSDEEYRTASEGGRRGSSEDWSELPPSPPLNRCGGGTSLNRVKDRVRVRTRLPRNQSRQSTLDSTSTDEIDCIKCTEINNQPNYIELNNEINKQNLEINDLQKQLNKALDEVRCLEDEIARLKKFQAEAVIQENKTKEIMLAFERTEYELNQRNSQIETKFIKEQKSLQRKLYEAEEQARTTEEKCNLLTKELQNKQRIILNLQEELTKYNDKLQMNHEQNEQLLKRIDELEKNSLTKQHGIHVESLTDLINIDLDIDVDELNPNELQEYCLELRQRFERAIIEIRCIKRELRESYNKCDHLEFDKANLQNNIDSIQQQHKNEIDLLVARLEHLTNKLSMAEKQLRTKSKESKDKRRSLSLKGRESFSLNKEVEDKVIELEAKILALEQRNRTKRKYKRERSSERNSPIDDRSLRRLRRKSLDSATTASTEPLRLLMRLNTLETKVTNVNGSNESLNQLIIDETPIKQKIKECLNQINHLKTTKQCTTSNLERLTNLEQNLNELNHLLDLDNDEMNVVNTSVNTVVKQLQNLLMEKLISLSERKRTLKANNKLDKSAKLQILAEKIAYENILINRIQEALISPSTGETTCERLIVKEMEETNNLIVSLQNKLQGILPIKQLPQGKTGVDYLTKILTKCLLSMTTNVVACKNLIRIQGPSLDYLINEQKKIDKLLTNYKTIKLPQLAEALATETMALSTDKTCRLRLLNDDTINDFNLTARDIVNAELIQSEINHVLLRAAQIYQNQHDLDQNYFFSFFAAERATLELWSDAVNDCLQDEINKSINELNEYYQNQLNKLQRQNWRRRLESERNHKLSNTLLQEYADIVAHKSLIDARILVLSGKFASEINKFDCGDDDDFIKNCLINDKFNDFIDNNNYLVQINQSLETEFLTMLDRYSKDCYTIIGQSEQFEQLLGYFNDLSNEIVELQKQTNLPVSCDDVIVRNWYDVCQQCKLLRDRLEEIRQTIGRQSPRTITKSQSFKMLESLEEHRPVHLGTEYLTQVENLRASYRCALQSCKERHQIADLEQLQILCERVLVAMEQWHRRTIHELREQHQYELDEMRREKEQALAEETQATLAALDAMRKAHEAEVQREVAKFKQEWARQQRDDLLDLSERLSVKCLEAAALEEQLTHAQQHILQLERNPQLSPMQN